MGSLFGVLRTVAGVLAVGAFLSAAGAAPASAAPPVTDRSAAGEIAYWNAVKDSGNADDIMAYLNGFPNGMFYDPAVTRYERLTGRRPDGSGASASTGSGADTAARPAKKAEKPPAKRVTASKPKASKASKPSTAKKKSAPVKKAVSKPVSKKIASKPSGCLAGSTQGKCAPPPKKKTPVTGGGGSTGGGSSAGGGGWQ